MTSLLAGDLVVLAWDHDRGKPSWRVSSTLQTGVGGALLLDAVLDGVVSVEDGRVVVTGTPQDPLLGEVTRVADAYRRPPKVQSLVQRLGTGARQRAVVDRLVAEGVLRREQDRVLGLFPVTRHPLADPAVAADLRGQVVALLTGASAPEERDDRLVMLAALAGATSLVDELVDRGDRRAARKRAKEFSEGDGISPAVRDAIESAQAATIAAITAAGAASASSSGSG